MIFSLLVVFQQTKAFAQLRCGEVFESPFRIQVADVGITVDEQSYYVWDRNGEFYFKAKLDNRQINIKAFLVNHTERLRSSIHGAKVFDEMMEHFSTDNVDVIQGRWFPFSVSNYQAFKEAREKGLSLEESAFSTWTGRQAQKYGYTYVDVGFERAYTGRLDPLIPQTSENMVEYVKANFYKIKPSHTIQIHRPRITRSWPMIK